MDTLQVNALAKNYGRGCAVDHISFAVQENEIFSLIGPNGAGKTTTIRMIATLITPTEGDAVVDGHSIRTDPVAVRGCISYLADEAGAYQSMTGRGYLLFMAQLCTENDADARRCADYAAEVCALGDRLKDRIGTYSRGMIRKLLLARAVMTRPKLAILDEPTSGLDIINALEIRRLIQRLSREGTSFLLSSHNMLEIDTISDRVGIIDHGKLLMCGTPGELKERLGAENLEEVFEKAVKGNA
ncbi:MAG: ABC transporter ATP-binding protein [Eubacteriales bacterium]|nr:ABC transporter ATP-binding protein [Eubacteriales bacterium]